MSRRRCRSLRLCAEEAHAPLVLPFGASPLSRLRVLGQIANTYIVADGPEGMYLIDQHAAHESVLYYRLLRQWANSTPEVQPMLEPLPMSLTPQQMDALGEGRAVLERYGLLVEPFGDDTLLVRAVPVMARRVTPRSSWPRRSTGSRRAPTVWIRICRLRRPSRATARCGQGKRSTTRR